MNQVVFWTRDLTREFDDAQGVDEPVMIGAVALGSLVRRRTKASMTRLGA